MEYKPNGKGIMTPVEDVLMVYSPNGKDVLWKIVFRSAIVKVLDKKKGSIKDTMSIKISFFYIIWKGQE